MQQVTSSIHSNNPFHAIIQKCKEVEKIINEGDIKQLHQSFPEMVTGMVGINAPGWRLPTITMQNSPNEFKYLRDFIGPGGPLFRMVHRLQLEGISYKYEYHSHLLPLSMLGSATATPRSPLMNPPTYSCKETLLPAYEYFFYCLAFCITSPLQSQSSYASGSGWQAVRQMMISDENLYFTLIDDYLNYFLPLEEGSYPPKLTQTTSHTSMSNQIRTMPYTPPAATVNKMLKKTSPKQPSNVLSISQNEIWRSEMLVQILMSFWLSAPSTNYTKSDCPSDEVMRVARMLIKHIHNFANVHHQSPFNTTFSTAAGGPSYVMDHFIENLYSILNPKLFDFLTLCFEVWPLDGSFRVVIETWLSYIQPWRYSASKSSGNSELRLSGDRDIANAWYNFIFVNLPFYNKFLYLSFNRFLRMDLSTAANSLLLYRVCKIFGQDNLAAMIEDAEIYTSTSKNSFDQYASYSVLVKPTEYSLNPSPSTELSSEHMKKTVEQLIKVCQLALGTIKKGLHQESNDWSMIVLRMIGFEALIPSGTVGSSSHSDLKKSNAHLQESVKNLCVLFQISLPEDVKAGSSSRNDDSCSSDGLPSSALDMTLSPQKRYELINNMSKVPVVPNCDPDLQPIRSYENPALVRMLHKAATSLNKRYQEDIVKLCSRDDALGSVGKYCFEPSYSFRTSSGSLASKKLSPRISFRFFAHYRTLCYLLVYVFYCYLSSSGVFSSIFWLVLLCCLYCFLHLVLLKLKHKKCQ